MPITDAVAMNNWFPSASDVMVRKGHTQFSTGYSAQVESLMVYSGANTNTLFAAKVGASIYNATAGGAIGAAVVSGLTNARFQYVNVATSGGNFMLCVNGADKLQGYDGSAWWADGDATHDITGLDTATVSDINVFKNRVWMIEKNTLKAWYLGTSSIAGAATQFPLQSIAREGGYLVAMGTWTLDAGYGIDDMLVFVTSNGEVIVYRGTDPASASTWMLSGIWSLGSPVGTRCLMKYAGDLLIITQDGLLPLSSALQSSRLNPKVAITDIIQPAVSSAISSYSANFGWDLCYFAKENFLILNVPVAEGSLQEQYVMNTITKAWSRFTGWDANCWALFDDHIYFGSNGFVGKAWNTFADSGSDIQAECAQAFSYFGKPGIQKHFKMARPMILTSGNPSIAAAMNLDFSVAGNYSAISTTAIASALWDTAVWDVDLWAGGLNLSTLWIGLVGIGYAGGIEFEIASNDVETHWISTDIVFELGGIL